MVVLVLGLIFLIAVGAWVVALTSLLRLMRITPPGQRLHVWFMAGMFQFNRIAQVSGEAARPILKRYALAWSAFFVCIIVAAAAFVLIAIEQEEGRGAPDDTALSASAAQG